MGVTIPATPEYEISHPEFPPNIPNSERNHPPATSGIYLLAPYPAPPSHLASSAYLIPYPLTQKMLFHPNEPRLPGRNPVVRSASYLVWGTKIYSRYTHVLNVADIRNTTCLYPR
jgi:hypothetical protein